MDRVIFVDLAVVILAIFMLNTNARKSNALRPSTSGGRGVKVGEDMSGAYVRQGVAPTVFTGVCMGNSI